MPKRDDVYRKFGEVSEAAQLLETELGTLLMTHKCVDAGFLEQPDPGRATAILDQVNKQTLGRLIQSLDSIVESTENLEQLLGDALASRNRLTHSFYLQHNVRINSEEGREVMLHDLETIHKDLVRAYDAAFRLSEIDLKKLTEDFGTTALLTGHLPLRT